MKKWILKQAGRGLTAYYCMFAIFGLLTLILAFYGAFQPDIEVRIHFVTAVSVCACASVGALVIHLRWAHKGCYRQSMNSFYAKREAK